MKKQVLNNPRFRPELSGISMSRPIAHGAAISIQGETEGCLVRLVLMPFGSLMALQGIDGDRWHLHVDSEQGALCINSLRALLWLEQDMFRGTLLFHITHSHVCYLLPPLIRSIKVDV